MERKQTIILEVDVPQQYAGKFLARMTGDDKDVILAAELAMRARVGEDVIGRAATVTIANEQEAREGLEYLATLEDGEVETYGPRRMR